MTMLNILRTKNQDVNEETKVTPYFWSTFHVVTFGNTFEN